jgi:hypothetical protein
VRATEKGTAVKETAPVCGLLSGFVGLGSSVALMKGSAAMPWSLQSFSGESEAEKAFRQKARWWTLAGLIGLLVAFAFSAASSVASYLS